MPFLLQDDKSDTNSLLMMVLMNSMTSGLDSKTGFDSNFNMLLPILLDGCDENDTDCKKNQKNLMVIMMAMQTQVIYINQ